MQRIVCGSFVVCLLLGNVAFTRAEDQSPATVIDKAIQAVGGAEKLTKHKALSWKGKGTFYGLGQPIEFSGEWFVQPPKQFKNQIDIEAGGMKIVIVTIVNGDKGWRSTMGSVDDIPEDQMAETMEEMYHGRVTMLTTLKQPEFKLTAFGDSKVGDEDVTGVKVQSKGHKDINLYFSKKTGFLVKSQRRVKDQMTGQEVDQEQVFSDHKDFGGLQRAKKLTIKRDGKDYVEMEVTEYKGHDKLDDSLFDKPGQ